MTTTTTTRIAGADPASHAALVQRINDSAAAIPRAMEWDQRLLAGVQLREVETTDSYSMMRGRAVPYATPAIISWYVEEWERGSLWKSIMEAGKVRDLPLNLFHENHTFPIGAAAKWEEADDGLWGTWRLDGSERAQEAARLAKPKDDGGEGMLTGLSIEFSPIRSEWWWCDDWNPNLGPDHMDRCTRLEARLGAVALCQTPAFVTAGVDMVRHSVSQRQTPDGGGTPVLDAIKARTEALRG